MFENLSPEFNFDPGRSPLANPISQKLKETSENGASNNAADRQNEGRKGIPQKNARNDEAGEGEPCQPCKHGAKSHDRSTQDTGSDTSGQPKQAFIEVHIFLALV
jgi:ribosomal protein L4